MKNTEQSYKAYVYALTEQVEQHSQGLSELSAISQQRQLTFNERSAAERNLQVLAEAAIGAAKHLLKSRGNPVPSEARATLERIYELLNIQDPPISTMRGAIALRNAIVHDYLNLDWDRLLPVVKEQKYLAIPLLVKQICQALLSK